AAVDPLRQAFPGAYAMAMQAGFPPHLVATVVQIALRELESHLVGLRSELRDEFNGLVSEKLESVQVRFRNEMKELVAASKVSEPSAQTKTRRDATLTSTVHTYTLQLLGCSQKTVPGPSGRMYYDLPAPLPEGAEPRRVADNSVLWNPDWSLNVDMGVNAQFIQAVCDVVLQNGPKSHHFDAELAPRSKVEEYVTVYFRSLRHQYQGRNTEEGLAKLQKKAEHDTALQRKKRKADLMRRAVDTFKILYGEAQTIGVEALCLTNWQSLEHSDLGAATEADWNLFRDKAAAGKTGVELNRIYAKLRAMTRDDNGDSSVIRPQFRGPPVNNKHDAPGQKKRRKGKMTARRSAPEHPYQECISKRWAERTGNEQVHSAAPGAPEEWTIFTLAIPDGDLLAEDLGWVADAEDDD
ncbi:hypothetical protein C8Q80DRAFT_1100827, partial [Daedaleopsis nitida]